MSGSKAMPKAMPRAWDPHVATPATCNPSDAYGKLVVYYNTSANNPNQPITSNKTLPLHEVPIHSPHILHQPLPSIFLANHI